MDSSAGFATEFWLVLGVRVVMVKLLFNSCFSFFRGGGRCFAKAMSDFGETKAC